MAPLIKTHGLEKFYETGYGRSYVLRRIDIEIEQGEFLTFMGPSGAGKSTLLHILGMLDGRWDGEYEFAGHKVHQMPTATCRARRTTARPYGETR